MQITEDILTNRLLHAAGILYERIEQALGRVGLSSAQYGALEVLNKENMPLPLSVLALRLECVRSNMTQLVDRLESAGFVRRISDPKDRRVILAELTPLGKEKAEAGATQLATVEKGLAESLGEDQYKQLTAMLTMIE